MYFRSYTLTSVGEYFLRKNISFLPLTTSAESDCTSWGKGRGGRGGGEGEGGKGRVGRGGGGGGRKERMKERGTGAKERQKNVAKFLNI